MVRRIENSEPIKKEMMSYKPENQSHFYIGVDGDEPEIQEVEEIYISDDEPMVRRLGEENEDVAIIVNSGADVVFLPFEYGRSWGR